MQQVEDTGTFSNPESLCLFVYFGFEPESKDFGIASLNFSGASLVSLSFRTEELFVYAFQISNRLIGRAGAIYSEGSFSIKEPDSSVDSTVGTKSRNLTMLWTPEGKVEKQN